jgi:c-di-GMP-binding flagellar brake protein YcgR
MSLSNAMVNQDAPGRERVTSRKRLFAYLKQLLDSREHLLIAFPGNKGAHTSMLLELNPDKNYILMDQLNTLQGHRLMQQHRRCVAHAKFQGIEMTFPCELENFVEEDGDTLYRLHFPEIMDYYQRRQHYRANLHYDDRIPVSLMFPGDKQCCGMIEDISAGGARIHVEEQHWISCQRGDRIEQLSFTAEGLQQVECEAQICVVFDHASNGRYIGVKFIGLQPRESRMLENFVFKLQREEIKRRNRLD